MRRPMVTVLSRWESLEADTRRYYDDLAGDYHYSVGDWEGAVERQAAALEAVLDDYLGPGPHEILDAAVGVGTQALGLALRGHNLHGVDICSDALVRARSEAIKRGVPIALTRSDMRYVDQAVSGTFDAVICCDNSLPHLLTVHDLYAATRAFAAKLRSGGLLLISTRDYDRHLATRPEVTQPIVSRDAVGDRITFQQWEWIDGERYVSRLFILQKDSALRWSTVTVDGAAYRAWRREEISSAVRSAGAAELVWRLPGESGYHQPLLIARWP